MPRLNRWSLRIVATALLLATPAAAQLPVARWYKGNTHAHTLNSDGDVLPEEVVRWYRTHGEQFHTKLLSIHRDDKVFATLGSANFTRRNLADYNLEANAAFTANVDSLLAQQLDAYFNRLWQGDALNPEYTAPFGAYQDDSSARYWRYRLMEATGLSTF